MESLFSVVLRPLEGRFGASWGLFWASWGPHDRSPELRVSSRRVACPLLSVAFSLKAPLGPSFSFWGQQAVP